jgi:hypothetical protein
MERQCQDINQHMIAQIPLFGVIRGERQVGRKRDGGWGGRHKTHWSTEEPIKEET